MQASEYSEQVLLYETGRQPPEEKGKNSFSYSKKSTSSNLLCFDDLSCERKCDATGQQGCKEGFIPML